MQYQADNPGDPHISNAVAEIKRKLAAISAQQSDSNKSRRMAYGLHIADHVHPAYLRRAGNRKAKSFIPDLEMHDEYFSSEVISGDSGFIDKTQGEQERLTAGLS